MQNVMHIATNAGHTTQNDNRSMQNDGHTTCNVGCNTLNVCQGPKGGLEVPSPGSLSTDDQGYFRLLIRALMHKGI